MLPVWTLPEFPGQSGSFRADQTTTAGGMLGGPPGYLSYQGRSRSHGLLLAGLAEVEAGFLFGFSIPLLFGSNTSAAGPLRINLPVETIWNHFGGLGESGSGSTACGPRPTGDDLAALRGSEAFGPAAAIRAQLGAALQGQRQRPQRKRQSQTALAIAINSRFLHEQPILPGPGGLALTSSRNPANRHGPWRCRPPGRKPPGPAGRCMGWFRAGGLPGPSWNRRSAQIACGVPASRAFLGYILVKAPTMGDFEKSISDTLANETKVKRNENDAKTQRTRPKHLSRQVWGKITTITGKNRVNRRTTSRTTWGFLRRCLSVGTRRGRPSIKAVSPTGPDIWPQNAKSNFGRKIVFTKIVKNPIDENRKSATIPVAVELLVGCNLSPGGSYTTSSFTAPPGLFVSVGDLPCHVFSISR